MENQFTRTEKLIGKDKQDLLRTKSVLVFGIGGVGSFAVEALTRAGIGCIDIVDKDTVDVTNINRQLIATHDTVGMPKVEVMKKRMLSINPDVRVETFEMLYLPEKAAEIDWEKYDYIVDCIDNVTAKIDIISNAKVSGVPVISSMGTGNKLDPLMFRIADTSKTKVCPLARVIRKELKERGIKDVKVLYSEEEPVNTGERAPASISFVPSAAGLIIAGEVIKDLIK